ERARTLIEETLAEQGCGRGRGFRLASDRSETLCARRCGNPFAGTARRYDHIAIRESPPAWAKMLVYLRVCGTPVEQCRTRRLHRQAVSWRELVCRLFETFEGARGWR